MLITVFPLLHTINHIFLFYGRELTININTCQMAMPKLLCFLRSFCSHLLPIYVGRHICLLFTWMIHIFKVTLSTLVNEMSMPLSIYFRIWGLMLMTRNLSLSPPKIGIFGFHPRLSFDDNYPYCTSEGGAFECLFQAVTKIMSKNLGCVHCHWHDYCCPPWG